MKPLLAVINSPTASGKTGIAVEFARRVGGEIANADSQQVYHLSTGASAPVDSPWVAAVAREYRRSRPAPLWGSYSS